MWGVLISCGSLAFIFSILIYGDNGMGADSYLRRTEGVGFFSRAGFVRYFSYPIIAAAISLIPAQLSRNMSGNEKFSLFAFIFPIGLMIAAAINGILRLITPNNKMVLIIAQIAICVLVVVWVSGMKTPAPSESSYSGGDSSNYQTVEHECYVCGESGNIKYGNHYYCSTHYAYVKTVVENS